MHSTLLNIRKIVFSSYRSLCETEATEINFRKRSDKYVFYCTHFEDFAKKSKRQGNKKGVKEGKNHILNMNCPNFFIGLLPNTQNRM